MVHYILSLSFIVLYYPSSSLSVTICSLRKSLLSLSLYHYLLSFSLRHYVLSSFSVPLCFLSISNRHYPLLLHLSPLIFPLSFAITIFSLFPSLSSRSLHHSILLSLPFRHSILHALLLTLSLSTSLSCHYFIFLYPSLSFSYLFLWHSIFLSPCLFLS